jgi:hypothetical protein
MMMNIRGLVFDDPRGTQGIKFSAGLDTLNFRAQGTEDSGQLEV